MDEAERRKRAIVRTTNAQRVTVAFPFSHIEVAEPGAALPELAGIVARLAELVQQAAPGDEASRLAADAQALLARLRG